MNRPRGSLALVAWVAILAGISSPAQAEDEMPALFALIIGVNKSVDADLLPLAYADDDAVRYHDLFRSLGARTYLLASLDENTRRISPQAMAEAREPRRADLEQALAALASDVARARARHVKTRFYFIYAGHGSSSDDETAHLTLEDARLGGADIARDIVARVHADETHLIVDACYSYLLAYGRGPGGRRREIHDFSRLGGLADIPGVGLLLSTSSASPSHEWEAFQAGVFSHEVRSGLYGAADADGDGQVSYQEIAAFVARANAAIPNEQLRPQIFARPPSGSSTIIDLRRGLLARRLTVGADTESAHYLLEDVRGNRLADFHNAGGHSVSLLRPMAMGQLFLRRLSDNREFEIPTAPSVVRIDELTSIPARSVPRGAADHAFRLIFSLPFDGSSVRSYVLAREGDRAAGAAPAVTGSTETATRRWQSIAGVTALVAGAAAGLTAAGLTLASRSAALAADSAPDQRRTAELNQQVSRRNQAAGLAVGLGGAAAIGGALLLLWPEATKPQVRPLAQVGGGDLLLGIKRSF